MNLIHFVIFIILSNKEIFAFIIDDAVNPAAIPGGQITDEIIPVHKTKLNFTDLASKCGFPAEKHVIITRDGYKLEVFRIKSKENCNGMHRTPPVIMMHGLADSADTWLLAGCDTALGYVLANACYDVWCATHRGDFYGRAHQTLDPDKDADFWNFAFEELGEEDLPSIIDYVTQLTDSKDVLYVGHSQGTSDFFIMTSSKSKYNDKIRLAILLAPFSHLDHIESIILRSVAAGSDLVQTALNLTGVREVFGRKQSVHEITEIFCTIAPETLCNIPILAIAGDRPGSISRDTLQLVGNSYLSGTSVKNIKQFAQVINNRRYARYDYGCKQNLDLYGVEIAPEFDLSKVRAPVVLMAGQSDKLASIADVDHLNCTLPNVLEYYIIPDPGWGHGDFVWGRKLPEYITPKVLEYFEKYSNC